MGCDASKTKETKGTPAAMNNEASEFLSLAKSQHHPVAEKLLEEWTLLVDAESRRNAGDSRGARAAVNRPKEIWADTEHNPVSHRSVDNVGKLFLEYIKADLSQRGWGGNFDYKVAGVAKQGFLKANATIDTSTTGEPNEVAWEVKIHYHSVGAA